mmetsp:Transcript_38058/g.48538  ORF Transcript_38058/g.48538 Transcript_38058/m.48538 type:complete len:127 (+) Transcript_38058:40-420(+)
MKLSFVHFSSDCTQRNTRTKTRLAIVVVHHAFDVQTQGRKIFWQRALLFSLQIYTGKQLKGLSPFLIEIAVYKATKKHIIHVLRRRINMTWWASQQMMKTSKPLTYHPKNLQPTRKRGGPFSKETH